MSTELRRFRRLALAICAVLALLATALGVAGLVRGPDLAGGRISTDRAVTTAGERLLLRSRQPLIDVDPNQVRITPTTPFTVETRDNNVAIRFNSTLAYGTAYDVTVSGARSRDTGRSTDWHYSFTTPSAKLHTLVAHRTDGSDQPADIVLELDGDQQRKVLVAPAIEEYIVVREHVVAISLPDETRSELIAAARGAGPTPIPVLAPNAPALGLLRATAAGDRFGYTATGFDTETGRDYDNTLFVQDASDLTAPPTEITVSGKPLAVQDWLFVPGVAAVVALDLQGQAQIVYLNSDAPGVALGSHDQLLGFLPGTTTLVTTTRGQEVLLDLTTGESTPMPPSSDAAAEGVAGRRVLLSEHSYVQELNLLDRSGEDTTIISRLAKVADNEATTLIEIPPEQGQLLDCGVSPNGHHAWATVLDPDAPIEDLTSGASNRATTLVLDLDTNTAVATVRGGRPIWALP